MQANPSTRYRLRLADQVVAVPVPGVFLIGRGADCDLALAEPTVSRKHARLVAHEDGRLVLEDLGSVQGVTVNGTTIRGSRELAHGDRIGIGASILVLVDALVRRSSTRPSAADAGSTRDLGPRTVEVSSETDAVTLEHALESGDRVQAEAIATRVVTAMTRGAPSHTLLGRVERSLAMLGETDPFWLDRILDLRAADRSVPDAHVVTRMHALARAGHVCSPDVLARYLTALAPRTDLPTSEQVLYRRMQALSRALAHG